ncbi:hypothetical protein DSAG12_00773 [Promethearchaeum syntrophicum]|uniref:Uncharacterized protein n=1 Tax=Promethearchaeum syntrophicum TaxID=2594042 RepID=A0A5B9D875_9ARCH|nr:hypothetical protein [Candidatus Prometheoarchaeum syntrophicum]
MAVAISYFHRKIGPIVWHSYPEEALTDEEKGHLADIMDQAYEEGFFMQKFGTLTSMNYYFEIPSEWARGNKELLMISLVLDSFPQVGFEKPIQEWAESFANRLRDKKEIYKAFYNTDDSQVSIEDHQDLKEFSENIRFWLKELYWVAVEVVREKTEEEKWAVIMSHPQIFKVIKKLSKEPMDLEVLNKWFITLFPNFELTEILKELEEQKFIFINTIGQDTYVLLVRDVNIMRVPPDVIIDLEEDSPDLADLTEIYINEVRDFFETYTPTPLDSLSLFELFADPKVYNVISQLREGPLPKEKILSMVSDTSSKAYMKSLDLLVNKSIIQEFSYSGEFLYLLRTDVVLTASFPEYLKRLLPRDTKGYIARQRSHKPLVAKEIEENSEKLKDDDLLEKSNYKMISRIEDEIDIESNHDENRKMISERFKTLIKDPEEKKEKKKK